MDGTCRAYGGEDKRMRILMWEREGNTAWETRGSWEVNNKMDFMK